MTVNDRKRQIAGGARGQRGYARTGSSRHVINACVMFMALMSATAPLGAAEETPSLSAAEIMDLVRTNLPDVPVAMSGQLRSGPLQGGFKHKYYVEIAWDFGRRPMTADYVLRDQFGGILEQLYVLRHGPTDVDVRYASGTQPVSGKLPPANENIQATDVAWSDLTLSFLWWPTARLIGRDTFRGRDCLVVELIPPETPAANAADSVLPETRRLWVDEKLFVFLQMEVRLAGQPARRMITRSFKKINDQWMVKDLEIRAIGLSHRSLLQIEDVKIQEQEAPAAATVEH